MNELTTQQTRSALALTEDEAIQVLQSSLYPGAAIQSIKMVLGYCRASGLDPFQKPVHIVPMWDSKAKQMRDVVMPGIGLYRTQAARTGCAGISEPDFGPDVTENIGGQQITYPAWCRVTVKRRLESGDVVEFTAKEFWKENYATKGGADKSIAPNAMWTKRPYGQLAKCSEGQALRKAFPEVGSEPTADEMAGKSLNDFDDDISKPHVIDVVPTRPELPAYPQVDFEKNLPEWQRKLIDTGKKTPSELLAMLSTKATFDEQQKARILSLKKTVTEDPQAKTVEPAGDPWLDQYEGAQEGEQQ